MSEELPESLQNATSDELLQEQVLLLGEINDRLKSPVVVKDIDMSFGTMIGFILKWVVATAIVTIPIWMIVGCLWLVLSPSSLY